MIECDDAVIIGVVVTDGTGSADLIFFSLVFKNMKFPRY